VLGDEDKKMDGWMDGGNECVMLMMREGGRGSLR
jgi:hypothetical protein